MIEEFENHVLVEGLLQLEERPELRKKPFWQHWIAESQGLPDQVDRMATAIAGSRAIQSTINNYEEGSSIIRFDAYPIVKDIEGNFLGPKSYIQFQIANAKEEGYYSPKSASYNSETKLLDGAFINLRLKPRLTIKDRRGWTMAFRSSLTHELVHVYEDYSRRKNKYSDLSTSLKSRNYRGVNNAEDYMEWFHYLLDPAEQRAFTAEVVDDVKQTIQVAKKFGRISEFVGIRDLRNLLTRTSNFWGTYEDMKYWVYDTQWDRMPSFRKKAVEDNYERITGKRLSYDAVVKTIRMTWEKFSKNLEVKASQALMNALADEPKENLRETKDKLTDHFIYSAY